MSKKENEHKTRNERSEGMQHKRGYNGDTKLNWTQYGKLIDAV